jgi:hypothetical protein
MKVSGYLHTTATSCPKTEPPAPTEWETGWAPKMVWSFIEEKYVLPLPGIKLPFLDCQVCTVVTMPAELVQKIFCEECHFETPQMKFSPGAC